MKIIVAAGGTAGHINPALAVADYIKSQQPDADILFVGRKEGMEYSLVKKAGYNFRHMEVTGFQRRFSLKNVKRNIVSLFNLAVSAFSSKRIINEFKPDLVFGTGGYVSGPIVRRGAKKGIKTAVHEQNAFPGMTNKILSRYVDKVFVADKSAIKYMAHEEKCTVTGNPVRREVINADRISSRSELGLGENTVAVLSFGGSLGAAKLNDAMKTLVLHNRNRKDIVHYHVVGRYDNGDFVKFLQKRGIQPGKNVNVFEYLYDMPKYMAASDIIISRCGALTIAEIACMGKASILIPSPNVAENHQYYNGKVLADVGAGILIEEKNLDDNTIIAAFDSLYSDREKIKIMSQNAKTVYKPDCTKIIYKNLLSLMEEK
jgi:UDP-N-acetylglucosamine--N-acetylmuramyl-(pentapeptide) pyrophosphoryl-undecaprenol N-acetylglucosamine transferase